MIVTFSVPYVFGSKKQESTPSEEALLKIFDEYLRQGQFSKAESYYQNTNLNLNALVDKTQDGSESASGSRLLINYIQECNYQVVDFLLNQGANINLPAIEVFRNIYYEGLTEGFDLEDQSQLDRGHHVYKKYPIGEAVGCPESDIFYRLFKEGASQPKLLLYGAIKWSDKALIKNLLSEGISVDFIPDTHDTTILDMLVPHTNGKQFGELESDEGGEVYASEFMKVTRRGDVVIVKFLLEAGADPNECLPFYSSENGYYPSTTSAPSSCKATTITERCLPAITPLSIARGFYKRTQEKDYKEIITLLEQHGAKNISECYDND